MFLIVAGGERPGRELLAGLAAKADLVIAADRGARYCLEAGITPGLVVGDMDSLEHDIMEGLAGSGVELMRFSADKDRTDTEIAIDEAAARGAKRLEILGSVGDRFDHTLANVHLLHKALRLGIEARLTSEREQIFLVDSSRVIRGAKGRTVSFLPLTERVGGISLKGFCYELEDAAMEIGVPYGISNVILAEEALVKVKSGILIAVLTMAET